MLIAEEFLLLSLGDESGRALIGGDKLQPGLGGALLAELALMERIGVTPRSDGWRQRGRVSVTSLKPTDDPVLDATLAKIAEREGRKVSKLISDMSTRRITKGLKDRLLERLVARGVLAQEKSRMLGFIPRTTWPLADATVEDDVRQRLQSALIAGLTPTERTVTLIAIMEVTGLLTKVVPTEDKKALRARAKTLTEGDWAAKAVKDAIDEVAAATSVAAVAGGGG